MGGLLTEETGQRTGVALDTLPTSRLDSSFETQIVRMLPFGSRLL